MKRLLFGLCAVAALACVPARRDAGVPAGDGPLVVFYKTSIDDGSGPRRGAKLAVWAERPDRLHAELIAPVGGVSFVLDAGGGKVCVTDVAHGTAYVGEDGPGAIAELTGVRVSVAEAIAALFDGVSPSGVAVVRTGVGLGSLPDTLRIQDGDRILAIERLRVERGRMDPRSLGTGDAPPNLRVRPLAELATTPEPRAAGAAGQP